MRINNNTSTPVRPLIRLRSMAIGTFILAVVISGPLLIVTKQVYINNASIKMNKLSDSLKVLDKQIATLQLNCERLSANDRIESFAREELHLDYPVSSQIAIVKVPRRNKQFLSGDMSNILSVIKKALGVSS